MNDSFVKATISGLLGTLGDFIIHWISFFTLKTTTTGHYIARLLFPTGNITFIRYTLGDIIHFASGSFVGIFLFLIFKYFGKDYPYFKGISLGIALWIIHTAVIPNIINIPRPIIFRTELECVVDLLAHLGYGIIATTYLIKTWKESPRNR